MVLNQEGHFQKGNVGFFSEPTRLFRYHASKGNSSFSSSERRLIRHWWIPKKEFVATCHHVKMWAILMSLEFFSSPKIEGISIHVWRLFVISFSGHFFYIVIRVCSSYEIRQSCSVNITFISWLQPSLIVIVIHYKSVTEVSRMIHGSNDWEYVAIFSVVADDDENANVITYGQLVTRVL